MTRDELILTALTARPASTAELAKWTGLTERTCRNGLYHLIAGGYAWSPERGRWRLTEAGQAIASALPGLPLAGRSSVAPVAAPVGGGRMPITAESAALPAPRVRSSGLPASLGWALAGVLVVFALAVARRLPTPPPEPPPTSPPSLWPDDGWQG